MRPSCCREHAIPSVHTDDVLCTHPGQHCDNYVALSPNKIPLRSTDQRQSVATAQCSHGPTCQLCHETGAQHNQQSGGRKYLSVGQSTHLLVEGPDQQTATSCDASNANYCLDCSDSQSLLQSAQDQQQKSWSGTPCHWGP